MQFIFTYHRLFVCARDIVNPLDQLSQPLIHFRMNIHVPGDPATLLSGDAVGKRGLLVTGFVTTL